MVERIGSGGGLAREAILAAMKAQAQRGDDVRSAASALMPDATRSAEGAAGSVGGFETHLSEAVGAVDSQLKQADALPANLVSGKVSDFHEVAVQLKQAEFSFRFAMEIRNKLVDAYREVMRMNV